MRLPGYHRTRLHDDNIKFHLRIYQHEGIYEHSQVKKKKNWEPIAVHGRVAFDKRQTGQVGQATKMWFRRWMGPVRTGIYDGRQREGKKRNKGKCITQNRSGSPRFDFDITGS